MQRPLDTRTGRFLLWGLTTFQWLILVYWLIAEPGFEPTYTLVSTLAATLAAFLATTPVRQDTGDTTRRQPLLNAEWVWPAVVFVGVLTVGILALGLVEVPARLGLWLLAVTLAVVAAVFSYYWLTRRQVDQFERKYRNWWRSEQSRINTFGLRGIGEAPRVQDIFVDLRVVPDSEEHAERRLVTRSADRAGQQIWHFLRQICSRSGSAADDALVILGGAGFGKTTMMQHVALEFAFRRQRRHGVSEHDIPILLYLRDHVATLCGDNPPGLDQLVQHYFSNPDQPERRLNPPDGWFERQLKAGRCLVLLDGMDEVASIQQRKQIAAWIDRQIGSYPQSRFVVTSRPGGYKEAPLQHPRRSILGMQSFTFDQRREFLEKWYTFDLCRSGKKPEQVRPEVQRKVRDVLAELRTKPVLNEFAGNPLLLTMIAIDARDAGGLPATRSALFGRIYELLVTLRVEKKRIEESLQPEKKKELLRTLAMFMMENRLPEIATAEAQRLIEPKIRRLKLRQHEPDFNVLNFLHTSTNLIVLVAGTKWLFAHAMFREYLAALELRDSKTAPDWRALVQDAWWHETLLFYAALGDATPIIQACLDLNTIPALVLAAMCLDETSEVDPDVIQALNRVLIDALEADDLERFRLAADVLLVRRLRATEGWQLLDEQRAISTDYITCAEYQLFLDAMRAEGEYYQPDHWTTYRFPPGQALEPIAGMRGADAEKFCEWLTARQMDTMRYRLPMPEESRAYPAHAHTDTLSAWCRQQDGMIALDNPHFTVIKGVNKLHVQTTIQKIFS